MPHKAHFLLKFHLVRISDHGTGIEPYLLNQRFNPLFLMLKKPVLLMMPKLTIKKNL